MTSNSRHSRQPPDRHTDSLLEALDDERLLERIATGDEAAFECLYRRYYRRLLRFLLRVTQQAELAEELLSDTFMTVWAKASTFAGRSRASTWITGIAYRKAIKRLAQHGRYDDAALFDEIEASLISECDSPDAMLMSEDVRQHLQVAMSALSPAHRAVVELAYFQGYSYPEITALTDCPVNTVKTRMFHARIKLRSVLESVGLYSVSDNRRHD